MYLCLLPLVQNDELRCSNTNGEGRVLGVSHAVVFAQLRRAVCQRKPSLLCDFVIVNTSPNVEQLT